MRFLFGKVESINRSNGGVPKKPVSEVLITKLGLEGDHQQDRRYHGGPDRAVLLYSLEKINGSFLNGEFSRISQKLYPGWSRVCARVLVGGTVRIGDAIEVLDSCAVKKAD